MSGVGAAVHRRFLAAVACISMDWLKMAAEARPDAPALIAGDEVVSYGCLDEAADSVAAALTASGVAPGARVAVWGSVTPKTVAAIWGIPRAGAAAVMLRVGLRPEAARDLASSAGASVLWDRVDDPGIVVPGRGGAPGGFWGPPDAGFLTVVFTSGSGGPPKGVIISGENVAASTAASQDRLGNGPDDPWLCPLPLAHIGGLMTLWRSAREAAPVVLLGRFSPWTASEALHSVRFASLVPTMLRRVADRGDHFDGLRGVLIGGGPATPGLLQEAIDLGIPALQTYGSTETSSQVTAVAPDDALSLLDTAGRPLSVVALRITGD
ncbi:AMP-binding protein, partial [bacterium]|nr:AMP-binding protein [bacterium]